MKKLLLLLLFSCLALGSFAQDSSQLSFWQPAPQFHRGRFWTVTGTVGAGYTATSYALARAWYANYDRSSFHFFNDNYGWRQMDKMGHLMTTNFEAKWLGHLYHWAGMPKKQAAWVGFGGSMLFQGTIELMDGYSEAWGFSWGDVGFNTLGASAYLAQELFWEEQRVLFKLSVHRPNYANSPIYARNNPLAQTSLQERANQLYGSSFPELFFKEYNGQTIWMSVNIASFLPQRPKYLPPWLNIAFGYGIENVFGAERNRWYNEDLAVFEAPANYPRMSQYYLSLDVDFERIPTKSKSLKSFFMMLNVFKLPFPALEYNSQGQWRGHFLHF
ncbi:DUF2279 domain-containing protein [Saprospira grandis]|uniref:DUF2279 domain-containing protein n=1 Tax=Saprospira grandis TaxID=1008 RepID=UPI0022DDB753|nr:DUF2279 domain-containing protein [Saprospira grandis]WBM74155.1 YfiM family protein [Saprospira grandis]